MNSRQAGPKGGGQDVRYRDCGEEMSVTEEVSMRRSPDLRAKL